MRRLVPALAILLAFPAGVQAQSQAQSYDSACLSSLRSAAGTKGVSSATFEAAMSGISPDRKVLEFMDNQPEFKTPIWDYLAFLVDDEKIADGRAMLRQWSSALAAAEARFGVDRHIIVAVWGVESDFGKGIGKRPLVQSLSTLACYAPRRNAFYREQFADTMLILERGDVAPENLTGSWAGAFGHTQFMPSTFMTNAVDLDGDGRRDIAASVPDALGSTANYLRRSGWSSERVWGYEVRLPEGFSAATGRGNKKPISTWASLGVTRADGRALSGEGQAGIILPAGRNGPAFLVTRNFDALYAYNAAESYALAIAHLADRLRGGKPFVTPWPTDDPGLSRAQRREVQERLVALGYDIGGPPTGAIGPKTRAAIKDFQGRIGLPQDGRAGAKVLASLQASR